MLRLDKYITWDILTIPGWKADGRDIGWAESIALELSPLILINKGFVP